VIRVLVADDHPLFRDGLRTLASLEKRLTLVGEAENGIDAVERALELEPDVVVMDLHMPDLNGIEATRRIVEALPDVGVLVLTMFEDDDSVFAAMRVGARGYLLKGAGHDEVVRAIEAVARGEAIFGPSIATRVIEFFSRPSQPPQPFPDLTAREREILELVAQGKSNHDIAAHFVLSPKTVRNNVSSIFTKLRVADRAQAIVRAREAGLGRA
jgi:DNA-binding NarL/FixJ family response regulator